MNLKQSPSPTSHLSSFNICHCNNKSCLAQGLLSRLRSINEKYMWGLCINVFLFKKMPGRDVVGSQVFL